MTKGKILGVCLTAAMIAAVFTGCDKLFPQGGKQVSSQSQSQADSQAVVSIPEQSVAPQESSSTPSSPAVSATGKNPGADEPNESQPGAVPDVKTDDKAFNQKFSANPIDKAYIQDSANAISNLDMVKVANQYAQVWADEVNSAYKKVIQLAKGDALNKIKAEQNDWTTGKAAALAKISKDAQAAGGTMVQVTEASAKMTYYRSRAVEIYKQLYTYDKNYTYAFQK
jgi:hypothetical protein